MLNLACGKWGKKDGFIQKYKHVDKKALFFLSNAIQNCIKPFFIISLFFLILDNEKYNKVSRRVEENSNNLGATSGKKQMPFFKTSKLGVNGFLLLSTIHDCKHFQNLLDKNLVKPLMHE